MSAWNQQLRLKRPAAIMKLPKSAYRAVVLGIACKHQSASHRGVGANVPGLLPGTQKWHCPSENYEGNSSLVQGRVCQVVS